MGELIFIGVVVAVIVIVRKISEAMREAAEEQRRIIIKKQQGGAPGQTGKKPDLQNLLEALAKKAESRGAEVRKPSEDKPQYEVRVPAVTEPESPQKAQKRFPSAGHSRPGQARPEPVPARVRQHGAYSVQESAPAQAGPWETEPPSKPQAAPSPPPAGMAEAGVTGAGAPPEGFAAGIAGTDVMAGSSYLGGYDTASHGPTPSQVMNGILSRRSFWKQAILLKEVLGAPRALRPYGEEDLYGTRG